MDQALRADSQPMSELNTTPLIDVMLVLLVMLIITIPIQTHAVKFDLPQPCPRCPDINPTRNEIAIAASGATTWNGVPITFPELRSQLAATRRMRPAPELHLRPAAAARYEAVGEVLGLIKRERVRKVGFVGNEAYANRL